MTYTYRQIPCPDCRDAERCLTCEDHGEVDAQCADCSIITALNDDGICERCADSNTLPITEFVAKYGFIEVEHLGPGRIAA